MRVFSDAELAQLEALASVLSRDQIGDYFGLTGRTVYAIMERQPEAASAYKRGRAKAVAVVATGLLQRARDGDNTAAIFYLKTQANWRETAPQDDGSEQATPVAPVFEVAEPVRDVRVTRAPDA